MIKVASFNLNSIKARLPRLIQWLNTSKPDLVCLQELKCREEDFPFEAISDAGYNVAVFGQKTFNGVAILSKFPIEDVVKGLPSFENEVLPEFANQARYIEAVISLKNTAIRIASVYVPNGGGELINQQKLESTAKFQFKIQFFSSLKKHYQKLIDLGEIQILGGDFNVACSKSDIYDPCGFDGQILFHPFERKAMRSLLNLGMQDSYRLIHPQSQEYSWWDYRGNSWNLNKGARIDYLLLSPLACNHLKSAGIEDRGVRDQEKASDHCPVFINLDLN